MTDLKTDERRGANRPNAAIGGSAAVSLGVGIVGLVLGGPVVAIAAAAVGAIGKQVFDAIIMHTERQLR